MDVQRNAEAISLRRMKLDQWTALPDRSSVQLVALAVITLIAALLRFYKLGEWSFWGDEMLTVVDVPDGFNEGIFRRSFSLSLIQAVIGWLGTSEWSARLAPSIIGILTVPVLYLPIRRLLGPGVGLLSMLLLALSPWHVYWSQNARFYTLLLLFYTLALLFLFWGFEEQRPLMVLLGVLFLGLAARERLLALFLIPAYASYVVLAWVFPVRKSRTFPLRSRSLLLLLVPIMLAVFYALPYLRNPTGWLAGFGGSNNSPLWIGAGVLYYLRLPVVALAAAGAVSLISEQRPLGLLLSLSAVIPPLALVVVAPFHYTANRYAFVSLTSWLILAAAGAMALIPLISHKQVWPAMAILVILLSDPIGELILYYNYNNGNRDDWKSAFALVRDAQGVNDLVVSNHQPVADFYMGKPTLRIGRIDWPEAIVNSEAPVWIVQDMTMHDFFRREDEWIRANARLMAVFDNHVYGRNFRMRVFYYDPGG